MSFATKAEKTPQDLWKELEELGSRVLLTIPFGTNINKANGFIAVTGGVDENLPILTLCVENIAKKRCTISTIVFPSTSEYSKFVNSLWIDYTSSFEELDLQ